MNSILNLFSGTNNNLTKSKTNQKKKASCGSKQSDIQSYMPSLQQGKKFEKYQGQIVKNLEKKILVSHLHAAGTKSELSGIPGNAGLRKAIEEFQPDLFIHSHIHELEGVEEKIGKTRVINVGRRGKIFEI